MWASKTLTDEASETEPWYGCPGSHTCCAFHLPPRFISCVLLCVLVLRMVIIVSFLVLLCVVGPAYGDPPVHLYNSVYIFIIS